METWGSAWQRGGDVFREGTACAKAQGLKEGQSLASLRHFPAPEELDPHPAAPPLLASDLLLPASQRSGAARPLDCVRDQPGTSIGAVRACPRPLTWKIGKEAPFGFGVAESC